MRLRPLCLVASATLVGLLACSTEPDAETPLEETAAAPDAGVVGNGDASSSGPDSGSTPVETCGAGKAKLCAEGAPCAADADCATDYCEATCAAPPATAATDGRRNAGETDVDCGGANAPDCEPGKACKTEGDCTSTCTGGKCDAPSDADGKKNQDETDVDCGGPNAKTCTVGKACAASTDCTLAWCKDGACAKPAVDDTIKNGTETDVDCGGTAKSEGNVTVPAAPRCALTASCLVDGDCASGICSSGKVCVEAPSCRPVLGGATCGTGEVGQGGAKHESCCKNLPVPGLTMVQGGVTKQVYLDKYEVTAGRVREWISAIKAQYGGVPNIKAWVEARMATDPILAAMFSTNTNLGAPKDFLPAMNAGQLATVPVGATLQPKYGGATTVQLDFGLQSQLGPTSYYRDVQVAGTDGCYMGAGSYGHRTYWSDQADSQVFGEVYRDTKDVLDVKSMNCMTPIMFAAFCAWDGGYMQSVAAISTAYGPYQWPWGDTPTPQDNVAKIANYNAGTGNFGNNVDPRYLWPIVNYGTFANDFTPIIAAPGRFPGDIASASRPNQESWMDLGGNMIEWSQNGTAFRGWTGASFEGHNYPRTWTSAIYFLDKYGKGSTRCMRLK